MLIVDQTARERGFAVRRFMCRALVARAQATRLAAVLVSLALCAGFAGLSATAAAAAVIPHNVTAVATTDSNDDGTVQVNWAAPSLTDMAGIVDADVSVDGQHAFLAADYAAGVAMYPVAPGTYTVSVVFDLVGGGTSAAGTATVTVDPAIAPNAVTDVVGSSNGTDVTVSWTPAQDVDGNAIGAPVHHYTVSLDGGVVHVDVPAGETEAQFTGVVPGTYALSVIAVNAAGSSIAATGSLHVTGATVASEPLNVAAQDTADGTVGVTWDPPASNGGNEIQYYEVQLTFPDGAVDADGNPVWSFDSGLGVAGSARDWTFYNVPFDQGDYVVTVTAHNASGDGPAGSTDSQPMVHSTAPGAPQHVSATSPEPNNALVSWDAPSADGGQPINEYDISLAGNTRFTGGDGRNVTISGIAAGTYTAQVTAFNSNGFSQTSTAQVTVADYATPPVVKPKAPSAKRQGCPGSARGGGRQVDRTRVEQRREGDRLRRDHRGPGEAHHRDEGELRGPDEGHVRRQGGRDQLRRKVVGGHDEDRHEQGLGRYGQADAESRPARQRRQGAPDEAQDGHQGAHRAVRQDHHHLRQALAEGAPPTSNGRRQRGDAQGTEDLRAVGDSAPRQPFRAESNTDGGSSASGISSPSRRRTRLSMSATIRRTVASS